MMVVTATSRASINYCLCQETILVDDCGCDATPEISPCKHSGGKSEAKQEDNCLVDVSIDIEDYITSSQSDVLLKQLCSVPYFPITSGDLFFRSPIRSSTLHDVGSIHLPITMPPQVPLFVRHSVFRI